PSRLENGITIVQYQGKEYPMAVFGNHNLMNMNAAMLVCEKLGISNEDFLVAMQSFKGASKRLELVKKNNSVSIFKDFAHSPSKLQATISAVREQFPNRKLVACMELHTFSSLTQEFLTHYKNTMDKADVAMVYYNHHALQLKRLPELDKEKVYEAFARKDLRVFTDKEEMIAQIRALEMNNLCLLMMSSGNFDGIDFKKFADELI
ncbi:MAG: peptidoglycan synthetase, partial [Bacteroidales bacterium]|nr:peptidoglycan synthetase [Bacteroidales bacterium]